MDHTVVHDSSTEVFFKEAPGIPFNSVFFEATRNAGLTLEDLITAAENKLEINKTRKYPKGAEYYRDYDYASQHLIHQLRLWLLRGEKTYQEVEILTEPINWWQMLVRDHFPAVEAQGGSLSMYCR